jgi:chemotaxis protein methyltransferase CheR
MIEITNKEFQQFAEYIKENYGINFKDEKRILVTGRLQTILQEKGITRFSDYLKEVMEDKTGEDVIRMLDKITTNHTFFMREADHFDFFKTKVLPELKNKVQERDLRIWCAASSTGEEPYTLAMILHDFFEQEAGIWDKKILATDLSNKALLTAMEGIYSNEEVMPLPPLWKSRYFTRLTEDEWEIRGVLKQEVIFRKFNLMEQKFPFRKKFHVIFCRNVMIYFDTPTRTNLVQKMYDSLEPGGYLFVGHSESVNRMESEFQYVMPSVYQKKA